MCPLIRCSRRGRSRSGSAALGGSTRGERIARHSTAARPMVPRRRPAPCSSCSGIRRAMLTASPWRTGPTSRSPTTTRVWSASRRRCRPTPAPCSPSTSWICPRRRSTTRVGQRSSGRSPSRPSASPRPSRPPVRSRWWCTTAALARRSRTTPRCARIWPATATSCWAAPSRAPTAARSTSTALHGSAEDVQFLVRWARAQAFVDVRRVGLVGHSAGAQAMLRFAAQPWCVGDAVVLLDTTQDYYPLGIPFFEPLVREVTGGMATLTKPMLVAANPTAMFALCDTLVNAERTYVTVPELEHNDFISQGQQRLARIARSPDAGPAEAVKVELARAHYRALCECVLQFLDATLRGRQELATLRDERTPVEPHSAEPRARAARRERTRTLRPVERRAAHAASVRASAHAPRHRGGVPRYLSGSAESASHSPMYTDVRLAGSMLYHDARRRATR